MKEIDNLFGKEPRALEDWRGTVADAMARRDAQVDQAVDALRRAAGGAAASVAALTHVVNPEASRRPAGPAAVRTEDPAGFTTLAEQLHDIALQLRELESSVRSLLTSTRKDAAPDE
jgi:2,4-dienoyl-CoA reductase-like NADH-dependent reductase (Old Yellow Enzyme family)